MSRRLRHLAVAVGVIYDPQRGFLLRFNPEWQKYAFVMKKATAAQEADEQALAGLAEDLSLQFPAASAQPIDRLGAVGPSGRTGEETYYDYSVFQLDLGELRSGSARSDEAAYFTYEHLQEADNVSWSTKEIARALVETREIVAAVITRPGQRGPECLLVQASAYGYFCPSACRRSHDDPESLGRWAVTKDTGYDGAISSQWVGEVEFHQSSQRFGDRSVRFRCHVCRVELPDVDLSDRDNRLAQSLQAKSDQAAAFGRHFHPPGYAHWFPIESLATGERQNLSPTLSPILSELKRAAEGH